METTKETEPISHAIIEVNGNQISLSTYTKYVVKFIPGDADRGGSSITKVGIFRDLSLSHYFLLLDVPTNNVDNPYARFTIPVKEIVEICPVN